MRKYDVEDIVGWSVVCLIVLALIGVTIFGIWQSSIRNDFCGDVKIVANGEYQINKDCFGDEISKTINTYSIGNLMYLYKVPQGEYLNGADLNLDKLVEGKNYTLYEKQMPFSFMSYFVECSK